MISVEIKIKEAINELKQITPPARPCLFKICAETQYKNYWFPTRHCGREIYQFLFCT